MGQIGSVLLGCLTQLSGDDVEDFDIDGSQVRKLNFWVLLSPRGPKFGSIWFNLGQIGSVISGCITQPPDDDLEGFDIDGSQV